MVNIFIPVGFVYVKFLYFILSVLLLLLCLKKTNIIPYIKWHSKSPPKFQRWVLKVNILYLGKPHKSSTLSFIVQNLDFLASNSFVKDPVNALRRELRVVCLAFTEGYSYKTLQINAIKYDTKLEFPVTILKSTATNQTTSYHAKTRCCDDLWRL